ncbi:MAG: PQQ-binding-like beta-propeller repeat protein, partial [Verrucomicrobiota bacterium]
DQDAAAGGEIDAAQGGAPRLGNEIELWRQPVMMFTSSPTLVGDRVYQVSHEGELYCLNAETGEIIWHEKLDTGQIHASPAYVDGLLIVPMNLSKIFIVRPSDEGCEILERIDVEGNCLGSPSISDGMVYVHTTERLYAFSIDHEGVTFGEPPAPEAIAPGEASKLAMIPSDVLLAPGERHVIQAFKSDEQGVRIGELDEGSLTWDSFIPPTARVKAKLDATFEDDQLLVAGDEASQSAGMFQGTTAGGQTGYVRGRLLPSLPIEEDFEGFELTATHAVEGIPFAFPPLPWIGARLKWEVRELDGNKVLAKTLDRILFQRCLSFIGHPDESNYTMQADVMTDGNRRVKSTIGLINQRYNCSLIGNANLLEISSNHERVKESVPFTVQANTWYTLKVRVDVAEDGSGVVRGKVWARDSDEPEAWTIEVAHSKAHKKGAPGLFGFSPQSQKRVFIDNIKITPNS